MNTQSQLQYQSKVLVTGASGNLGRKTVELLLAAQAADVGGQGNISVVAGSRKPEQLEGLRAQGAETRAVDFEDEVGLRAAFAGIDRLLIISTDALDRPGRRVAQHRAAIAAAVEAGVQHVVYTSIVNASPGSAALVAQDHYETEQAIIASGLGYTILRNGLYADNLLGALPHIIESGRWHHAAGEGRIALVTREDCASIAAAALAADFTGKRVLDVTGPELRSYAETAALVASITGTEVKAVALAAEALTNALTGAGLPLPFAQVLVSFDTAQAAGEYDTVASSIEELTGQKATSLEEFLKVHLPVAIPAAV